MDIGGLLHLAHKEPKGLITLVQELPQLTTNRHRALIRVPSLG